MSTSGAELLRQIKDRIDEVDPAQARELASNGAVLVDVREAEEFAAGHIPGARNLKDPPSTHLAALETLGGNDA